MAAVRSLKLLAPPEANQEGVDGMTHTATFQLFVDEVMPGAMAVQLAQELVGTLPSQNPDGSKIDEIPNPGDRFFYSTVDKFIEDLYPNGYAGAVAFWNDAGVPGSKFYDGGAIALGFVPRMLEGSCGRGWNIDVTFRAPRPGKNEQPEQVRQILAGRVGAAPPEQIDFENTANIERWIEQRPFSEMENRAYLVTGLGTPGENVGSTLVPMLMPNGEEFPPIEVEFMREVLVIARNVDTEDYAYQMNSQYGKTFNDADLQLGPRTIPKFQACYENTRTGRPIMINNDTFYRAETRLVLFTKPPYLIRPAYGTYYLDATGQLPLAPMDDNGMPLSRVPLTQTGQRADVGNTWEQPYSKRKPVSYADFSYT